MTDATTHTAATYPGSGYEAYRLLAAQPARDVEVDPHTADYLPWMHVGDPLAEAALIAVRAGEHRDRNVVNTIRSLAADGDAACRALLRDVETVPPWVDFDRMRVGAEFAARNPLGMLLGMFCALPLSYATNNTAKVLVRTNNLLGAVPRRVFETGTLFVTALDVDGLRPGGAGWELALRIRMMHTMVRLGVLRSGGWDPNGFMPVAAAETALSSYFFGTLRARAIADVAGFAEDDAMDGFHMTWRYICRMMGGPPELICATTSDQQILEGRVMRQIYSPTSDSIALTRALLDGLPQLEAGPPMPAPLVAALMRRMLRPAILPEIDANIPDDLQIPRSLPAALALPLATGVLRTAGQLHRIPPVRRHNAQVGLHWLETVIDRGLAGQPAEYHA